MGLSSITNRVAYIGDATSTVWAFPYYFFSPNDLQVFLYDINSSVVYPQTLNTNYSVTGTANQQGTYPNGGNVVTTCSIPTNLEVVIVRGPALTQNYYLAQNQGINAAAIVQEYDYLTAIVQGLQDQVSRCVQLPLGMGPISGSSFNPVLPATIQLPGAYANSPILVNSGANGFTTGLLTVATTQIVSYFGILPVANGGTGQANPYTQGGVLYASNGGLVLSTAGGSPGQGLLANASSAPTWGSVLTGSVSLSAGVSGILPVGNGGTGTGTSYIQYGLIYASSATQFGPVPSAVVGFPLVAQGSAAPSFQGLNLAGSGVVTGLLGVASGGTGAAYAGSSTAIVAVNVAGTGFNGVGATATQAGIITVPTGGQYIAPGGSPALPGYAFATNGSSGWYSPSASQMTFYVAGSTAIDVVKSGTSVIIGLGCPANSISVPVTMTTNYGSAAFYQFGNVNAGSGASSIFQILGGASSTTATTIESHNAETSGYLAGGGYVGTASNQTQFVLSADATFGKIFFNVGGRDLAHQVAVMSQSSLTLTGGKSLQIVGSGATGWVQIQATGSVTTYPMNLPVAQGAANTVPTNDGAGNLTWQLPTTGSSANLTVVTLTVSSNVLASQGLILISASTGVNAQLFSATTNAGAVSRFKRLDAGSSAVFIIASGTAIIDQLIGGTSNNTFSGTSVMLISQNESVTLAADGTNYQLLDHYIPPITMRWNSASGTIGTTLNYIGWKNKDYDAGAMMSIANQGLVSIPRAGKYHITCGVNISWGVSAGDLTTVAMVKNGTTVINSFIYTGLSAGAAQGAYAISDIYSFNSGDSMGIAVASADSSPVFVSGSGASWFAMSYIGP